MIFLSFRPHTAKGEKLVGPSIVLYPTAYNTHEIALIYAHLEA